jgi:transposase
VIAERTFAWLARYRRNSKDYEHTTPVQRSDGVHLDDRADV